MDDKKQKIYKGLNGTLIITDKAVIIKRGLKGFLLTGFIRGEKTIPFKNIVSVEFKKAGLLNGYLQLTLKAGTEAKKGYFQAVKEENTITFWPNKNKDFEEAKNIIESKIF